MYFYIIYRKGILGKVDKVDFFVNENYVDLLKKFISIFDFSSYQRVYIFNEPLFSNYSRSVFDKYQNLAINLITYLKDFNKIKRINFSAYESLLIFADDMLHFQYLIYNYKKNRKNGIVYLIDEGIGLYVKDKNNLNKLTINKIMKKLLFNEYKAIPMGCNSLVDVVLARIPKTCNCYSTTKVKKIDYKLDDMEDVRKWFVVFRVDYSKDIQRLFSGRNSAKKVLFLGFPFKLLNIPYNKVNEFLLKIKQSENVNIIIKPHPKEVEDLSLYNKDFEILSAYFPAELLFSCGIKFKFVISYISSALIEAKLNGQETYYFNFSSLNNIDYRIFEKLGIREYVLKENKEHEKT